MCFCWIYIHDLRFVVVSFFAALYSMRACDLNSLEMSDGSFKMWSWSFEGSFFIASSSFRFNSFVLVPTVLIFMFIFRITYTHITLSLYIYTCIILVKKYLKIILSNPCIQCIDANPRICRLAHIWLRLNPIAPGPSLSFGPGTWLRLKQITTVAPLRSFKELLKQCKNSLKKSCNDQKLEEAIVVATVSVAVFSCS